MLLVLVNCCWHTVDAGILLCCSDVGVDGVASVDVAGGFSVSLSPCIRKTPSYECSVHAPSAYPSRGVIK